MPPTLRPRHPAACAPVRGLAGLPGVHNLQTSNGTVRFNVDAGALDAALRQLTAAGVRSLTSQPPTLEELFLRHYQAEPGDAAVAGDGSSGGGRVEVPR